MTEIVIVEAVRTALGRRNGMFRDTHPVRLGASVVREVLQRANVDPSLVDHVVFGCVSQIGDQAFNVARNVVLDAELPIEVPATSIDFQCGSSQQALHMAVAMVASGQNDVVIAGGVENMSRVPMGSTIANGQPFTDIIMNNHQMIPQGISADKIAQKWGISREQVDDIGYESHMRAAKATQEGWFAGQILALDGVDKEGNPINASFDEGIRPNADRAKMAQLEAVFTDSGVTTAGNSSQISDGAAALLVMTADRAKALGLKPRARVVATATVGSDPHLMLTGPIPATQKVLSRAGLSMSDIDLFEVNEAFAAVIGMWQKELDADMSKVNVHGGAIALGHPLGGSGARLLTTLIHALETHDKRYGLQTMCCGGGMGTGTILERLG